jgi:hypothetical protein
MKKQPFAPNLFQLGTEDSDTRFDMDMINIEAYEQNLSTSKGHTTEDLLDTMPVRIDFNNLKKIFDCMPPTLPDIPNLKEEKEEDGIYP